MASPVEREPLAELPLFDFMPPPNSKCACPSPLSVPSKRGPPTPRHGSTSTPKRPRPVSTLHNDELGTGRSPARRLFTDEPATPNNNKPTTSKLAPSPPLPSNTPIASTPASRRQANIHSVGFVIYQDEENESPKPAPVQVEQHRDEENIPPTPLPAPTKQDQPPRSKLCIRAG